jgi:MraZ protein
MLRGEAEYALDEKGRVVIPPKFRAAMGEHIIVTRWVDPCLAAFSPVEWQTLEERLRALPVGDRDVVRLIFSGAHDCDLDRQGRIFLPPHLRQHAGITRQVTIVGVGQRLEIWDSDAWRKMIQQVTQAPEALAERLKGLIL